MKAFALLLLLAFSCFGAPRKIVLIAGPITGHPKDTHEYEKNVVLLKHLLDNSLPGQVKTEVHFSGWPENRATFDDADTIVFTSDGTDRNETHHPLYVADRIKVIEKQMRRGCGLIMFHWSTFSPTRFHDMITEWVGGYFDYETGLGPRKWYSAIQTWNADSKLPTPTHPICHGVKPFTTQEEYYYRIRFRENDSRLTPIVTTRPPKETEDFPVGWAVERKEGGRGFGFTGGHFYKNWWSPDFRKLILNAIAWTAKLEIPPSGIDSELPERAKALVLTGYNHPAHDWQAVTAALIPSLEQDPRLLVHVTENVEDLASEAMKEYRLVILNYCNWDRPGLSDTAKQGLVNYLQHGGGLTIIHFANGAFNYTLPATNSDWPEFRTNIVRRAWIHGKDRSGHDNYGPFTVELSAAKHPITAGLKNFSTVDELYFRQEGPAPIDPLATARSKVTGKEEPMAWAYPYGKGRVFQTVLGHSAESIHKAAPLIRRGCTWAAGLEPLSFDPPTDTVTKALFREGSQWVPH
jgi:type 1 glutamine amidotransferase